MGKKKTPNNVVPIRPDVKVPEKSNVVPFIAPSIMDVPPNDVLSGAMDKFEEVVVIGRLDDGSVYYASSSGYLPNVMWLLQRAVHEVHSQADVNDDEDPPPVLLLG
jgi:hypothetical protein